MDKRMMGIVLMLLGVMLFGGGLNLFIVSKKSKSTTSIETNPVNQNTDPQSIIISEQKNIALDSTPSSAGIAEHKSSARRVKQVVNMEQVADTKSEQIQNINGKSEIDRLIDMAIADGVLTKNEKDKIRILAAEHGLAYEDVIQAAEAKIAELGIDSETELIDINKKNGLDFEKYIVQKFNKKFFKIINWAGDKYVNGYYAEVNQQPDIQMEFSLPGRKSKFAVECKWRKKLSKNGVEFAYEQQFNRYRKFAKTNEIPVFIAIGIGGSGSAPERLYVVNLNECQSNFITSSELSRYERLVDKQFYFDPEKGELR